MVLDKFQVIIEKTAEKDLDDILYYISENLFEPFTAKELFTEIKNGILSLENMPSRFPVIDEKPFSLIGVRKFTVKNYIIFYIVDENRKKVKVFRILYGRRYWKNMI